VVVVAAGDVPRRESLAAAWPGWDADVVEVIAADGGIASCDALGLEPTTLVGDLDSVDEDQVEVLARAGVHVVRAAADKDESDTELAVLEATRSGATRVTILGALGGARPDHALANVWLLAHAALASMPVVLLDATARLSLVTAPGPDGRPAVRDLPGAVGGVVSLLPLGDVRGVTTAGLRYLLDDEPLVVGPARGISNVRVAADARITVRGGRLLVVELARPDAVRDAAGLSSPS